jgi:diacylglycerol kinase family enzyme
MHFIGVFNRDSGTFKTTDMAAFALRASTILHAHGHTLDARIVEGDGLIAELKRAAQEGSVLLAGGGDGTISAAAAVAYKRNVPLAVIPAGTMNLFARSLQLPLNLDAALEAIAVGDIVHVDIATANGRPFVHQFSVGIHAKLVKLRQALSYRGRVGKMLASGRAFLGAISNAPNFYADITTRTGVERRATAGISVSNNPISGPLPVADRLDRGVLGVYVIAPLTPRNVVRLAAGAVTGRLKTLPEIVDREAREVTLHFPRKTAGAVAAIDGELVKLADTVELKIHPAALPVVMPRIAAEAEPAARRAGSVLIPA